MHEHTEEMHHEQPFPSLGDIPVNGRDIPDVPTAPMGYTGTHGRRDDEKEII
jgi:hypothetical protein